MPPLVSVIIPVFNRPILVKTAIDSVLAQTYKNFEIVLVNDGSTDNTGNVLNNYEREYPRRIRVIHQENAGQVISRNNGIKISRGQYIAFLDSDDFWHPEKLEKQIPLFAGRIGLVYCGINEVDEQGRVINAVPCESRMRGDIYHHLLVRNRMTGGSVVVTRDAIDKVGLFDPQLKAAENWDLWIRIAKEYLVDFVNEPLVNYRKHGANMSGNAELMADATKIIFQKHFPVAPTDPVLRKFYDEAYTNYYLNLGLHFFARGQYRKSRKMLNNIKMYSKPTLEIKILILRTFLGKYINKIITLTREQARRKLAV